MFSAALFTIAGTWKQPRCSLTHEWIRKLCYIHTVKYYSAFKKNAFESVLMRWMSLEPIIQSEVSQEEKDKYCIITYMEFRKMVPMILHAGQQGRHRCERQTFELSRRKWGWGGLRENHWRMHITICKIDEQCKFDAWSRASRVGALGQRRIGWGGRWEEGFRIVGDTYIPVADSCWCMANHHNIVK